MRKKLSDKDKRDWKNFILNDEKTPNKDLQINKDNISREIIKTIDLHGFSLNNANKTIEKFIFKCFEERVNKIIVITGKGLRSKNKSNPYVSQDLGILKYSVPEFLQSRSNLTKIVKQIKEANIKDGGQGAFYIYLKNIKE